LKECVTAYWSMCSRADNVRGLKPATEARDVRGVTPLGMVGECSQCREAEAVRPGGALGSTDAGISSEKTGENPVRRKPKGS
jgi:hypothetical protein